jgi:hypothetical protein
MKSLRLIIPLLFAVFAAAHGVAQTTINWNKLGGIPSPTITAAGDATGTVTLSPSAGATLNLTLANTAVTPGTFKSVTVDSKGRVTGGTNPTTLAGYGITDAQPLDSDLTSIAALPTTAYGRGLLTLANSAAFTASVDAATTSAAGKVQLATNTEAQTGTDTSKVPSVSSTRAGVATLRNALAPRQAVSFLGGGDAQVIGMPEVTDKFTLVFWIRRDDTVSNSGIFKMGGANYGSVIAGTGKIEINGGSGTWLTHTTALPLGEWSCVAYTKTGTTGQFYFNGLADGTVTDNSTWTGALIANLNWRSFADGKKAIVPLAYNRVLSATEIATLYKTNTPDPADRRRDSVNPIGVQIITGADSDFTSDLGHWSISGSGNISGGKLNLGTDEQATLTTAPIKAGQKYRGTITITSNSGAYLWFKQGGSFNTQICVPGQTGTFTSEFVADGNVNFALLSEHGTVVLDDVTLVPIGVLIEPEANAPGNGLVWNDASGNGRHLVLSSVANTVDWTLRDSRINHVRGTTSTNGNQQILGLKAAIGPAQIVRARANARTGTPTVYVGWSSGNNNIVSSVTLTAATWNNLTIVLANGYIGGATDLWVNSNSTDVIEWDFSIEPLSF